ncbi:hypothetical protein COY32_04805 [candidate division WWE3 bacterium CG_4_10_14_0_2_um_filter_41_14]|uniref:Uncharacterized protein n=1 Tax=candidate division WWE3 bacterium CG_4_10_14_0_2_um_filter_41_14 TaxID=1975072 RepID=A0A2M7THB5_UNCKA|nr:MAG: hypothetical protein COY32_04805 [candidate division WWE3 bacterium CG_4_10_14_0_2_um_filter_41_14]
MHPFHRGATLGRIGQSPGSHIFGVQSSNGAATISASPHTQKGDALHAPNNFWKTVAAPRLEKAGGPRNRGSSQHKVL